MRQIGTLRNWNEERGFGFIAPTQGGAEIFVHVTAFARDGTRPTVGERLSYELGRNPEGKPQAVEVVRLAVGSSRPTRSVEVVAARPRTSWLGITLIVALIAVASAWGYKALADRRHRAELAAQPVAPTLRSPSSSVSPAVFHCDGRTHCSQMTSCAEAKWFIRNCPGTKMDGNNDGVPCQEQWCN
ncbi:cold shock domain-containing protein [Piscinibacter sakaiensis]|uniref:cold shock domain-containing protein n=1 Tax=Piscinibacter sakaiensis TaxID=1547922 RepID=UPI0009E8E0DC|nr:cold shock domain-containing protein [Piscinibacter sakaiensis]